MPVFRSTVWPVTVPSSAIVMVVRLEAMWSWGAIAGVRRTVAPCADTCTTGLS